MLIGVRGYFWLIFYDLCYGGFIFLLFGLFGKYLLDIFCMRVIVLGFVNIKMDKM